MTIDELQGSLNYAIRKCFTDARYKLQAPVTVPDNGDVEEEDVETSSSSIGQKLTRSGGSGKKKKKASSRSPRNSPRSSPRRNQMSSPQSGTVITARPYQSVKEEESSNSDEIIVMDNSDDGFLSGDDNVSIEF
jgi:hypothetical protein